MEVGEYVRTKDGFIRKIDKIEKCPVCEEKEYINEEIISGLHFQNSYHKKDITKHSKNPKDLIEEGDILRYRINNLSSIKIGEVRKYKDARSFKEYLGVEGFSLEQIEILKIVTKEQIKSIEYEV